MNPMPRHRRKRKIRRTGQHTTPSQVEKVAQTDRKGCPRRCGGGHARHDGSEHRWRGGRGHSTAATAPHMVHARLDAAALPPVPPTWLPPGEDGVRAAKAQAAKAPASTRAATGRMYQVEAGNTLSGITERFYGEDADWRCTLYAANESKISNPNMIYVGEELRLPRAPARACGPSRPSRRPPKAARTRPSTRRGRRRPVGGRAARPPRRPPRTCPAPGRPGSSVGRGGRIPRG